MKDMVELTNPDGTKFTISPDVRAIKAFKVKNINANSMVMGQEMSYLVVESVDEVRKKIQDLTYSAPPPPNVVQSIAANYGMTLAVMDQWKATFIFGTDKSVGVQAELDPNNLEDSISKSHMVLTTRYRELGRTIPYAKTLSRLERVKGGCRGC